MFINESGDLGERGSKYIVIACFITSEPDNFNRIIKNMRRYKFKRELRKTSEIKASNSSSGIIKHMLVELNKFDDVSTHFIVLEKGKMYSKFMKSNNHKKYNFISGKLARKIILEDCDVTIRIDRSKGKRALVEDFNEYFGKLLKEKSSIRKVKIHHSYSHSWSGLQFADILAWSCFQKFEHDNGVFMELIDIEKRDISHVF